MFLHKNTFFCLFNAVFLLYFQMDFTLAYIVAANLAHLEILVSLKVLVFSQDPLFMLGCRRSHNPVFCKDPPFMLDCRRSHNLPTYWRTAVSSWYRLNPHYSETPKKQAYKCMLLHLAKRVHNIMRSSCLNWNHILIDNSHIFGHCKWLCHIYI